MLRTTKQNRLMWALAKKINLDKDQIEEMVYTISKERTKSSRQLNAYEFQSLTNHLEAIGKGMAPAPEKKPEDKADKMRKKCLSICYDLGWTKAGKLDYPKIHEWIEKFGYLHKKFNAYTEAELPKLVTQFETLLRKDYAKAKI